MTSAEMAELSYLIMHEFQPLQKAYKVLCTQRDPISFSIFRELCTTQFDLPPDDDRGRPVLQRQALKYLVILGLVRSSRPDMGKGSKYDVNHTVRLRLINTELAIVL